MFFLQVHSCLLFLLNAALSYALPTNSPQLSQKSTEENVKNKRALNYFDSAFLGPPPPPHHVNSLAYIPTKSVASSGKFTNVFGFDDISYHHLVNKLNGINYEVPSHLVPPPFETPSLFTNGYGYINYGAAHNFDSAYISHDGRILKQYAVHERIHNDLPDPLNDYQPKPPVFTNTQPTFLPPNYVPNNFNVAQPRHINVGVSNNIPTFLNKNHGPVAFGSGEFFFM